VLFDEPGRGMPAISLYHTYRWRRPKGRSLRRAVAFTALLIVTGIVLAVLVAMGSPRSGTHGSRTQLPPRVLSKR
jgi:hypothetical protein